MYQKQVEFDHHKKRENKKNTKNINNHGSSSASSGLIEILQSFGIIVKTSINVHDRRKRENLDQLFMESHQSSLNYDPATDGSNDDEFFIQAEKEGKITRGGIDYQVNTKKSKIIIRFKCDFDHTKSFDFNKDGCTSSEARRKNSFNTGNERKRREEFQAIIGAERKNTNVIHIDFDLKFDSMAEIIKYLNILDCKNVDLMLENEILSRLVKILDVDHEKKQVFIKLKTFDTADDLPNLSNYFLMGKLDGTETCFMLDLTHTNWYSKRIDNIDKIYKYFTPEFLRNPIYCKNNSNTFHDCKDVGIYRCLIGCFFYCMTDKAGGFHVRRTHIHPYDIIKSKFEPTLLECPTSNGNGFGLIVGNVTTDLYNRNSRMNYGGIVDTGFYKFELKATCRLYSNNLYFRREFYHFSL